LIFCSTTLKIIVFLCGVSVVSILVWYLFRIKPQK
jgi:hypothetical protein